MPVTPVVAYPGIAGSATSRASLSPHRRLAVYP